MNGRCPLNRHRAALNRRSSRLKRIFFEVPNNLALLYYAQGQYSQAEPLYQRALAIREKTLGPEHPKLATSLENYAALLRKLDRTAEAESMEVRAKAIRAAY